MWPTLLGDKSLPKPRYQTELQEDGISGGTMKEGPYQKNHQVDPEQLESGATLLKSSNSL